VSSLNKSLSLGIMYGIEGVFFVCVRVCVWACAAVWFLIIEFVKNRGITEFSAMDELLVLSLFF
jgi:hypothetical protein